jgi:hypothetical protein
MLSRHNRSATREEPKEKVYPKRSSYHLKRNRTMKTTAENSP